MNLIADTKTISKARVGGYFFQFDPSWRQTEFYSEVSEALSSSRLFLSGRDALVALVESINPCQIELPDYSCPSLDIAKKLGASRSSRLPSEASTSESGSVFEEYRVVVVGHYFGQLALKEIQSAKADPRNIVASDVTHLLWDVEALALVSQLSDFTFASLRKFGNLTEGGILSSAHPRWIELLQRKYSVGVIDNPPHSLFSAVLSPGQYLQEVEDAEARILNHTFEAREISKTGASRIPVAPGRNEAKWLLTVIAEILSRRRNSDRSIRNDFLSPYVQVFFASEPERNLIRSALREEGFFLPVHWPGLADRGRKAPLSLSIPLDPWLSESVYEEMLVSLQKKGVVR